MYYQWSDFGVNRLRHSWEPALANDMTTNRARAHEEPSLSNQITRYSRYNTFIVHRIINPSFVRIHTASLLVEVFINLWSKKILRAFHFFFLLFSSHTSGELAEVLFWIFILSITLVCLITRSFCNVFLWNLHQSFTYVYSTSQPIYSITLLCLNWSDCILHHVLEGAITCIPFKWIGSNSIPINYIYILVFERSLKKIWRLTCPGEAYQSYLAITLIHDACKLNCSIYIKLLNVSYSKDVELEAVA